MVVGGGRGEGGCVLLSPPGSTSMRVALIKRRDGG